MHDNRFLHAVTLTLKNERQIAQVLRRIRLARTHASEGVVLFLADLPDAQAQTLPEDASQVRLLQSLVMSMNARRPGTYLFLVRKRAYDRAARMWLGASQRISPRSTLNMLLCGQRTSPAEAANFSPSSLADAFDIVLITDAAHAFPPDAPEIMRRLLLACSADSLAAREFLPFRPDESLFTRLLRAGFSLDPLEVRRKSSSPAIYKACALEAFPKEETDTPLFLRIEMPTLSDCLDRAELDAFENRRSLLPLAQLGLLLLSASFGWPLIALLTLILPEFHTLMHPLRLPGLPVRLAFLPRRAMIAADALLRQHFASSRILPTLSSGEGAGPFFGTVLLLLALRGTHALVLLLTVGLLWLLSPMIARALSLPVRERIPLSTEEEARLRKLCEDAFAMLDDAQASPAHSLAACAGCMLGLLEPDEAARRVEQMLPKLKSRSAFDCACLLCTSEYLTERMADCDAALRDLPGKIEALALAQQIDEETGPLAALLFIAKENLPTPDALILLQKAVPSAALDALFLPQTTVQDEALLALTHPHTFLLRTGGSNKKSDALSPGEKANRFLILSCAALHGPYSQLLLRSKSVAPYAPLLDL